MKQCDIFISYRRQDAEAHACMLYRDLTAAGYTVFYDHQTLGSGNFLQNIRDAIDGCRDVLVLFSKEALGSRIYDQNDVMRMELSYALAKKKRITGIMLSGFESFPKDLPEELAELPLVNCLYGKIEYYDAMLERLTSGMFLSATPSVQMAPQITVDKTDKAATLDWFRRLPMETKQSYMRLLLDISHEFNSTPECMRVYHYIDLYDRNRGLRKIEPYTGNIPTDFATYLSFFETIYLILVSETIDISLFDEMFRFRFFAMCNNPVIQKSELLPLGYQYPNVIDLYDLWSEYIRKKLLSQNEGNLEDAVYLYENDLHKRYRAYRFASMPAKPQQIGFVNSRCERRVLTLRRLSLADEQDLTALQERVVASIPDNAEKNIFEQLKPDEIRHSLLHDFCVGLYDGDVLGAVLTFLPHPQPEQNLLFDLDTEYPSDSAAIVDCIFVDTTLRGFGIQSFFIQLADFLAEKFGRTLLAAVVSPENYYSFRNFVKSGYRMVAQKPKYHSVRSYFLRDLSENYE